MASKPVPKPERRRSVEIGARSLIKGSSLMDGFPFAAVSPAAKAVGLILACYR
jgi:hypothetical protein